MRFFIFFTALFSVAQDPLPDSKALAKRVSELTGLKLAEDVPLKRATKKEAGLSAGKIVNEIVGDSASFESAMKAMGLFPPLLSMNYTLTLFGSQMVPIFYDGTSVGIVPDTIEDGLLVDYGTVALIDREFSIARSVSTAASIDERLSALAVLYGTAYLAKLNLYKSRNFGVKPDDEFQKYVCDDAKKGKDANEFARKLFPAILLDINWFPYGAGSVFVEKCRANGTDVEKLLKNLPKSTSEILHPENFGKGERRTTFECDGMLKSLGVIKVLDTSMGEFLTGSILSSISGKELSAASCKGDRFFSFKEGSGDCSVMWIMDWESEKDALAVCSAVAAGRGEKIDVLQQGDSLVIYGSMSNGTRSTIYPLLKECQKTRVNSTPFWK